MSKNDDEESEIRSELSKLADKIIEDFSKKGPIAGIRVNGVLPGSSADKAGIHSGDLIVGVSGHPIQTMQDYIDCMVDRAGTTQVFDIIRDNSFVQVSIEYPPIDSN